MADFKPHCHQARDDLVAILHVLREKSLVTSPVSDVVVEKALNLCQPCRGKKPNPKKCRGWSGSFYKATAIEIPFETKKRNLIAKVSGTFNFTCDKPPQRSSLVDWQKTPAESATFAIEIQERTGKSPCARHHIDLANRDQLGPVWHLQLGGLSAVEDRDKELGLDVPRWPALPMDLILVLELAIYNFRHEAWKELREAGRWRDIIKRSEKFMQQHYFDRLGAYWNRRDADHSWLAYQCNRTSDWDPCPGRPTPPGRQ